MSKGKKVPRHLRGEHQQILKDARKVKAEIKRAQRAVKKLLSDVKAATHKSRKKKNRLPSG